MVLRLRKWRPPEILSYSCGLVVVCRVVCVLRATVSEPPFLGPLAMEPQHLAVSESSRSVESKEARKSAAPRPNTAPLPTPSPSILEALS